ncbi:SRPBCC family protein [Sulfurirhabdus autotrophica]|uniref:Polyketide cyclase/dehydrase/lipid transport protein n=1 Tax=Sulfurirhabdus autotrophica TaxID=1706046 RepID=A0A4R3Y6V0_9PROT|nr:SRPBCC family protein [Sulfurirhabdus autotrophica]TCV87342.1 polyketide cyclase/dehydrase/lipid transport protein [Sulfurirhabdus autotrophica]
MNKLLFMLALLWVFQSQAIADVRAEKDIDVKVQIEGEDVFVDVNFTVPAPARLVWEVLTDFDHMSTFIGNLQSSKVIDRTENIFRVAQKGIAKYGPVSFPFESIREIHLFSFNKIQTHMVSGNIHKLEGVTQLITEGDLTRVIYHADTIPGVWIPPGVGKLFIEHETREQFQESRDEVMRRKRAANP